MPLECLNKLLPELILSDTKNSILFIENRIENNVVVAAHHHAPLDTQELPCPEHKDADENVMIVIISK